MKYDVSHRTTFEYSNSVSISHHMLHLSPRACPGQTRLHHSIIIEPPPNIIKESEDYFDNPTTYLTVEEPHDELSIVSRSTVEVTSPERPDPAGTPAWDGIAATLRTATERSELDVYQFVFDSPFTQSKNDALDYAAPSFPAGRPVLEGAVELMNRIHADYAYVGGVTNVYTPVDTIIAERRGVCQDFAHLQISGLRSLGIPSRYVSGYLQTIAAEGGARLVGADASHAWLSVWVPDTGWVDLDPTNNLIPGNQHITVAWGRDYGDVSPINGLVVGGGTQEMQVAVDVVPLDG